MVEIVAARVMYPLSGAGDMTAVSMQLACMGNTGVVGVSLYPFIRQWQSRKQANWDGSRVDKSLLRCGLLTMIVLCGLVWLLSWQIDWLQESSHYPTALSITLGGVFGLAHPLTRVALYLLVMNNIFHDSSSEEACSNEEIAWTLSSKGSSILAGTFFAVEVLGPILISTAISVGGVTAASFLVVMIVLQCVCYVQLSNNL